MIKGLISRLFKPKTSKSTIQLQVIASRMDEINKQKKELDGRLNNLEEKSTNMESSLIQTLDLTSKNQERLNSIEDSMEKMLDMAQKMLISKQAEAGLEESDEDQDVQPNPSSD